MAYRLLYRSPLYELSGLGTHVRHMQHEGRAGKWKRLKLFKENWPMLRKKTEIDNGQWTHLIGEIQVSNMFKLLKVVLLCSSAAGHLLARPQPAVDELYII